jgi:hypothetical protein
MGAVLLAALLATELVAVFVELRGPDGQQLWLSPSQVVSIREPRSEQHFAPGTRCLIGTADGKYLTVAEPCEAVRKKLQ